MRLHIRHNLGSIPKELSKLADRQIKNATYRATKETTTRVRKTFAQEIRKHINLPASGKSAGGRGSRPPGVKDMIKVITEAKRPSKSTPVGSIFATIGTSTKPISLIHFVRGRKAAPSWVRVPNAKRKGRVKVQIFKGQTKSKPKLFIQEAKGAIQVWRRKKRQGPDKMLKQAIPSLFHLVSKRKIAAAIRGDAGEYYTQRLLHHLRFYASGGGKASKPK